MIRRSEWISHKEPPRWYAQATSHRVVTPRPLRLDYEAVVDQWVYTGTGDDPTNGSYVRSHLGAKRTRKGVEFIALTKQEAVDWIGRTEVAIARSRRALKSVGFK